MKKITTKDGEIFHLIKIESKNAKMDRYRYKEIPKNTNIFISVFDFDNCGENSTEWTKLNALVNFIAGYYDEKNEFSNCEFAIDSNKLLFDIIKKIIKNKCNSELKINLNHDHCYQSDAFDNNLLYILNLYENSTEKEIYDCFDNIIFNDDVVFVHSNKQLL